MDILSKRNGWFLILSLLACCMYVFLLSKRAHVEIEIEVAQDSYFRIYWAEPEGYYSEDRMVGTFIHPGREEYGFFLENLNKIERLRIDTHQYKGEVTLKSIKIHQQGFLPVILSTSSGLDTLIPFQQIEEYRIDESGLWLRSSGNDASFELTPELHHVAIDKMAWVTELTLVFLAAWFLIWGCSLLLVNFRFVPMLLFGAWMLIIVMAVLSERNVHPDEYVHLAAIDYYQDNWLPPLIEDESIKDTYSVYGNSRLNDRELYYLVAGKFQLAISAFELKDYLAKRSFVVLLFGLIMLYSIRSRCARLVALPLLLSPQLWYVFSYCNSDAFALFLSFIVGCELVRRRSVFNRFLETESAGRIFFSILYLGPLFGSLFLLKKNYYPLVGFIAVAMFIKIVRSRGSEERRGLILRLTSIAVISLALFGGRVGADYYINGFDRTAKMASAKQMYAQHRYKADVAIEEKIPSLSLKEQGVTLNTILDEHRWFEQTFRSGFGLYGYFTITAPNMYYDLVRWTAGLLTLFLFLSIFIKGGIDNSSLAVTLLLLSSILIAASLNHSWAVDLQPQGRYLFVIIPMIAILFGMARKAVNRTILSVGVFVLYGLSAYSFICYGLIRIPKVLVM